MAIKTMSMSTGNGQYNEGWHTLTIAKAEYGVWKNPTGQSKRYIDVWFNDYGDNFNLRVYETFTKESKEEFKIANLFKNANAGIVSVLKDPSGKKPIIQYDDEATGLVGKTINAYFYKEEGKDGNQYARVFDDIAPVAQEGEHISYTEEQVTGIKSAIEKRVSAKQSKSSSVPAFGNTSSASTDPFAGMPE